MSVLIKGMEMPKNCYECMFSDDMSISKGRPFWGCTVNGMELDEDDDGSDGRNPGCPMIEVPEPHGRLIDADALCDKLETAAKIKPWLEGAFNAAIAFALVAPTIIPAEPAEEE